jgi:dienelactone hydrolase
VTSERRRRLLAVVAVVLVTVAVVSGAVVRSVGGTGRTTSSPGGRPTTPVPSRASPRPTVSPTPPTVAPIRNLAVSMTRTTFIDASRPVVSHGTTLAVSRTLPTYLWSPTGTGPYPLVVFAHGYDSGPLGYARFCSELASSGYVVAAPSFPLEDPSRGFGLDRADLPNEATDISFVITSLVAQAAVLRIAPTRVAVVGHSDGADAVLLIGYGLVYVDDRVEAVVADAPDPISGTVVPSTVPLLLVQGTADSVVPYSSSQTVFGQVAAPVYYLSLVGADHLPPIAGGTPWTPVLDQAVAQFLDATVAGRGAAVSVLPTELGASALVRSISKR